MWPDDPNWQMNRLFLLTVALTLCAMKLIALLLPATHEANQRQLFWLLRSPTSLKRLRPIVTIRQELFRTTLLCSALILSLWAFARLVHGTHIRGVALSYCAMPVLLLATECFPAVMTVLWLPSGHRLPSLHHRPWLARSVADFWGNRWNLWFSDWSRYAFFQRLRHRPVIALVLAFTVSGLLHEWVINVPLYFFTGRALFGTMMVYFLFQAGGVFLERRFLRRHACLMVVFTWLVVFVPAPLVLNEGLLRTLLIWPEQDVVAQNRDGGGLHSRSLDKP